MPARPRERKASERRRGRLKRLRQRLAAAIFGERILCDTCRFDYGEACQRPERPNATVCEDYEHG